MTNPSLFSPPPKLKSLLHTLPLIQQFQRYQREWFWGDLTAGIIVTSLLIPQGMAYAQLAGLPPQVGLYASIVPPLLYPVFGSSAVLAVGPVAVDSLMVAGVLGSMAPSGSGEYLALALTLAALIGCIQLGAGMLRLGFLVNFLSRSVISGFISGAAVVIGLSQLKHLFGVKLPAAETAVDLLLLLWERRTEVQWSSLGFGLMSLAILIYFSYPLVQQLRRQGWSESAILVLSKAAPLLVVGLGTWVTWGFQLDERWGLRVVGAIPAGLPPLTVPLLLGDQVRSLLPGALAISLVAYMEGFGSAQALAAKRQERVKANQELIALGLANLGAALSGGYPVTGGLSRSVVNFSAGAHTGLASLITGLLVMLTALFLTSLFYFLPQPCLAAIILAAVYKLVDIATFRRMWRYDRADAIAWLATFLIVLGLGVEIGVLVGTTIALVLHLWRTSRPHIAIVGRVGHSEHFRNVLRHPVQTDPHILALRVDESLYFANARYLEDFLLQAIAVRPEVTTILLVCSAINVIDASALEILEQLITELKSRGIGWYFSEVKGPVMDKLKVIGFVDWLGEDHIFLTTDLAMRSLVR